MKKCFNILLALSLISCIAFPACKIGMGYEESDELFVALEQTKIERFDSVELELGKNVKKVEWSSSDESVAVIENGKLIGLKAGTTVISAVKGNEKQEQTIRVVDEGKTPTIDVEYLPVMRGYSYEMDLKSFFNGKELSDVAFGYAVADKSIATLENDVLSGVAYGDTTVTISLSWRDQSNVATKTVPCSVTENVAVYTDKAEYTLYSMDSVLGVPFAVETQIQPSVYYEGEKVDGLSFTWESGDTSIATVDGNGKVSAVAHGETYVVGKCECNGKTLSTRKVPIKVEKPHLKTAVDLPIKVGSVNVTFNPETMIGAGYSVDKVVDLATGKVYRCTNNSADLSGLLTGEYTFVVYADDEAFSTEVNVVVADYLVSTVDDLKEATADQNAYVALINDLDAGKFTTPTNSVLKRNTGTFNGLGHTLTITYGTVMRSLYAYVEDFTFKNLAVKATITAARETGALFRRNRGKVVIENCYLESTITKDDAYKIGGIADQAYGKNSIKISNTVVKVNGLDRSEYVQEQCGALFASWSNTNVAYENVYVIARGKLASVVNGSAAQTVNKQTGILYQNDEKFIEAKNKGKIVLDTFNHYWDLSGDIPQFKQ